MLAFGSLAVPLVTVFIGIALGHQTPEHETLIDPRTRYPANYTLPVQGFPGLQSNWNPQPDCGEHSYVGHGRLRGRRALITGGDSGMGRAIAIAFAREGADVAFNYLEVEESDARETVSFIRAAGQKAFTIPGDLRNESFCADLVHRAAASLGGLDIVVSHAGYALEQAYIGNHSTESFEQTLRTNVYAPFFIARAAAPLLPPGSSLIFTASDVAVGGNARLVDYAATKAMLVSFTRSLALQLWPFGIRVNAVAPGGTLTNFLTTQGETTESINGAVSMTPAGRLAQPVEVAPAYVDLAEGINSYASGSVYGANGPTGGF
ncbi:NAD(P)-binding protein [Trichoderma afarasin]